MRNLGGITSEAEKQALEEVNARVESIGLKPGELLYELSDQVTGDAVANLDLVWPKGVQEGLTAPVALLLDEGEDTIAIASAAGFGCFSDVGDFCDYIAVELMGQGACEAAE